LSKKFSYDIFIQKQVIGGVEVIGGIKYDKSFGNVFMFGAGGVLAELLADINIKLLPLDEKGAMELVVGSKISSMLKGFRGGKPYALKKLLEIIAKLSNLAESVPYFEEVEINPIIVTEKDAWAVDGRMILNSVISL
jgi:acetyltransferase